MEERKSSERNILPSSPPSQDFPKPLLIVKTGDAAENYSFTLVDENLDFVLEQVPEGMKVAVVSVVGAFRTGKSFLLNFFLRYLHSERDHGGVVGEDWMLLGGDSLREGNVNLDTGETDGPGESVPQSFQWRGGHERMTTGIWMWSEPFIRMSACGENVAVLLVDTQGMFDNETSMGLTTCIFGLSTLISSHQIYNVEKRIQEDHLQQLALFSEYGRMALSHDSDAANLPPPPPTASMLAAAAASAHGASAGAVPIVDTRPETGEEEKRAEVVKSDKPKPFQLLEFLIRDWQNFDDVKDLTKVQHDMDAYLKEVIKDRNITQLQGTREQILSCYEKISCFGLCHPGFEVTKKTYDGSLAKIEPTFLTLLDVYTRRVFGDEILEPKQIRGRQLTAHELRTYIGAYVKLFHEGATFPEAKTMLEATAAANNSNAKFAAISRYKSEMEKIAGPRSAPVYHQPDHFLQHHELCRSGALVLFRSIATMGRPAAIEARQLELEEDIAEEFERYQQVNESRRPFKGIEFYIIPMSLAAAAFFLRVIADASCSSWSDTCRVSADLLSHLYISVFSFILFCSAGQLRAAFDHLRTVMPVLLGSTTDTGSERRLKVD